MSPRTNPKLRLDLVCNPGGELGGSAVVHRDHNHSAQRASEKSSNPLCAVFSPEHDPVAFAEPPRLQLPAKSQGHLHDLTVGEPFHAVTTPLPIGKLGGVR